MFSEINFEPFVEYHCGTFNAFMPKAWKSRDCESTLPYVCKKHLNPTDHGVVGECFYVVFELFAYLLNIFKILYFLLIIYNLNLAKTSLYTNKNI